MQVLLCNQSIKIVLVWCQSILRYVNVNIWRKWPWRSRSIDPFWQRVPIYTLWVNLEILDPILDKLSCRQAPFCENRSVKVQNDLEGQNQSRPFSKAVLLIPRCIIGANLVILAETGGELSRWQGRYGRTDRQMKGQSEIALLAKIVGFVAKWHCAYIQSLDMKQIECNFLQISQLMPLNIVFGTD